MSIKENKLEEILLKENEMSFKDFLNSLVEWINYFKSLKKVFIISAFLGAIIGFFINYIQEPQYKATLTFALEDDKSTGSLGGAAGIASSLGIDLGSSSGGAFAANNIMELMQSRLIIEKALLNVVSYKNKYTTLANIYIESNKKFKQEIKNTKSLDSINFNAELSRAQFKIQHDSLLYAIYKKITSENLEIVQKNKKVSILTLNVLSNNSFFAKMFCEKLAKEVSDFYVKTKSQKSKYNVDILQKQVDSVKTQLNLAVNGVASESDNVFNLNPSLNLKGTSVRKKQIEVQANTSILTQLVAQLELAKVTLRKETPLIQIIDTPIFPLDNINHSRNYWIIVTSVLFTILTFVYFVIRRLLFFI